MNKYNVYRKIIESDSDINTIDDSQLRNAVKMCKSDRSIIKKLVIGATVGATGAAACYGYLYAKFGSTFMGWDGICDFFRRAIKDLDKGGPLYRAGHDPLQNVIRVLYGSANKAINYAISIGRSLALTGGYLTSKIPFLNTPIMRDEQLFKNITYKVDSGFTYGSIFFLALIAAVIVGVIYSVYKIVKNHKATTEIQCLKQSTAILKKLKESYKLYTNLSYLIEGSSDASFLSGDSIISKMWNVVTDMFSSAWGFITDHPLLTAIIVISTMLIGCWIGVKSYAKRTEVID